MPVFFGGAKCRGRPLAVMAHLKRSIIEVKAENNCLAHALVIAKAKIDNEHKYTTYRRERKIKPVVEHLLQTKPLITMWWTNSRIESLLLEE
jgi:hypothetical protein